MTDNDDDGDGMTGDNARGEGEGWAAALTRGGGRGGVAALTLLDDDGDGSRLDKDLGFGRAPRHRVDWMVTGGCPQQ